MPWFKIDDHFWSHPKTAELSDSATALWLRAGSWSAGHLTDGRVPVSMLRMFRARRRSADELVAAGLWSIDGDAFVFHAWHEYQPSKSQVEAKREATRNRVKTWRERQGNGVTNASHDDDRNAPPDPTRPDPTRKEIPTESLSSETAIAPIRPEVTRLLDLLDTEIVRNGGKAPKRTKKNVDAVRLMLDRDGYSEAQIERAIRWCQADEFWRANILSASKLREKYEQLRLAAQRATHSPVAPDDKFHDTVERGRRLAALTNQGEIAS